MCAGIYHKTCITLTIHLRKHSSTFQYLALVRPSSLSFAHALPFAFALAFASLSPSPLPRLRLALAFTSPSLSLSLSSRPRLRLAFVFSSPPRPRPRLSPGLLLTLQRSCVMISRDGSHAMYVLSVDTFTDSQNKDQFGKWRRSMKILPSVRFIILQRHILKFTRHGFY